MVPNMCLKQFPLQFNVEKIEKGYVSFLLINFLILTKMLWHPHDVLQHINSLNGSKHVKDSHVELFHSLPSWGLLHVQ